MRDLLDLLIETQGIDSDRVFAKRLGIPRSTWQMTRTEKRKIGATIILAIYETLPEIYRQSYYYNIKVIPDVDIINPVARAYTIAINQTDKTTFCTEKTPVQREGLLRWFRAVLRRFNKGGIKWK